jgi:N-methylhydantoinase A
VDPAQHLVILNPIVLRVGVDIGGTFTDVVVFDETQGSVALAKALSTPRELARGVRDALARSGAPLERTESLIHGSTVVVNAIVERTGARTALLTTRGFRDVYEIGRINRPESFNPRFRKHRPLIPREMIFEIPERMLADGSVRLPLDESAVREVARVLIAEGVEAVAILFLHSYRAPDHELRAKTILLEAGGSPAWFVTASHELSREYREYERTSASIAITSAPRRSLPDAGIRTRCWNPDPRAAWWHDGLVRSARRRAGHRG